ncbi:MAG: hypothetical protein U0573_02110 [Phycisphaerales bacterium]|nr:hypothetical protein [Planctomycetota bacterium]
MLALLCALAVQQLRAYSGVVLRDNAEGTVVSHVRPGPFEQLLRRNDLVVSVNGRPASAAEFNTLVDSQAVGSELALVIRRGKPADPLAALPVGDPSGAELRIAARLENADDYTGTIGRASPSASKPSAPQGEFERDVRALALAATDQLPAFEKYLSGLAGGARDSFMLPSITQCFERPLSVDGVEARVASRVRDLAAKSDPPHIQNFVQSILEPPSQAAGKEPPSPAAAKQLARFLRDSVSIEGPDSRSLIATINQAPAGVREFVLSTAQWRSVELWEARLCTAGATTPSVDIPQELKNAVNGEILYFERLENGRYAVAGADGRNTYDMDTVEIVFDIGGNDTYYFGATGVEAPTNHIIIDLSGDDQYFGESDFHGPGVALEGLSFIDDRSGDDIYRSHSQFSIASGLFGVGVILDRRGNDRYENTGPGSGWSIGAGLYGAGLILDLAGDDSYTGEKLCEGAAGPFALGAIIDAGGNDTYTANGPNFASAYNTPGTFLAMSQGFSMGVRGYASGGIGCIYDLSGDDKYVAGEFSQGCGYFFSLGILHDAQGNDTCLGDRYSQAAAAHQAIGLLVDDAGNDRYQARTAACQSGAWDQSITLFVDRAGDDVYQAEDLCQGAAAQQALALFFDLSGNDRYQASGASVQGCSGSNEYHYQADRMLSFSLLADEGGSDSFSSQRTGTVATDRMNSEQPGQSRAFGVFSNAARAPY